jgi:aspartate/methionine/tyrosine aminotransferase
MEATFVAYAERRDYLMTALSDAGLSYGAPGGAFYIYTNISASGMKAKPFCEALLRETGVMVFPGDMFGEPESDFVRISYLQPMPLIAEAMVRIKGFMDTKKGAAA